MEELTTSGRDGQFAMGHFRESDVEFLRAQAKEWLEAVLGYDLDGNSSLEDLLADGSLLYKVSQHINDIKIPEHVEGASHSMSASPLMEKKNSLKYQPYASVEAFLKVCKEVGLQDLDLFYPSDAVDKKDIRRVCVCLRRLAKKGRTVGIQVPDFDNVKDTLVTPSKMPTDSVRRTQESLQLSSSRSCRPSSSNGPVSSDTSSLINNLRKNDAENESLKFYEMAETYDKVNYELDVAIEHVKLMAMDPNCIVKVAGPRVDILPLGEISKEDDVMKKVKRLVSIRSGVDSTQGPVPKAAEPFFQPHTSQEHVDRNGGERDTDSSSAIKDMTYIQEAHFTTKAVAKLPTEAPGAEKKSVEPFRGLVVDKPKPKPKPADAPVEENIDVGSLEQRRKGLFVAHVQVQEPQVKKQVQEITKYDNYGASPWLFLLRGAAAIAGGVSGLLYMKKLSVYNDCTNDEGDTSGNEFSGGLYKVREGESLTMIARKSGKKHWREIADMNPSIHDPDLIYPGDRLKL